MNSNLPPKTPLDHASLGEAFEAYRKNVISPKASPSQVEETRKAFYASSAWLHGKIMAHANDEEMGADVLIEFLKGINEEVLVHAISLFVEGYNEEKQK